MLIAVTVMLLGLLAGIVAAQLGGLRLGGVVVVPLFAVYTLRNAASLPVVLLGVVVAFVAVGVTQRRLLWYGRRVFVVAILAGAAVPVTVFEVLSLYPMSSGTPVEIAFVGSVLPGIAGYNFWRLDAEDRLTDAVWTVVVLVLLVVVGALMVGFVGLTPLRGVTPPFLLGSESDVADLLGVAIEGEFATRLVSRPVALAVVAAGMLCSEWLRRRLGLRLAGVIVLPLLVLFAFRNAWMVPLYLFAGVAAYVAILAIHRWSLLYGRVLLSMGVAVALLAAVAVTPALPVEHGLLPFFTAILSGVSGYNLHAVAPAERRATVVTAAAVFVLLTGLTRLFVDPASTGLLRTVTWWHGFVGGVVLVWGAIEAARIELVVPYSPVWVFRRRIERWLEVSG